LQNVPSTKEGIEIVDLNEYESTGDRIGWALRGRGLPPTDATLAPPHRLWPCVVSLLWRYRYSGGRTNTSAANG
jgi:hypothetical protein